MKNISFSLMECANEFFSLAQTTQLFSTFELIAR